MLSKSDIDIEIASSKILTKGYDVAFLVPTETSMSKSIMDAHGSVRSFLNSADIHNYTNQKQGIKKTIEASFIFNSDVITCKVSLYRPETKKGDPRIWIYGLNKYATPYNLIALIAVNSELFIVNCSNSEDLGYALSNILPSPSKQKSTISSELLEKLIVISDRGFIDTIKSGDTGVGMTLEHLLGISANSSKSPDYKGIELKSARVGLNRKQNNKKNLFSKVPKWKYCPIGTPENLVLKRGYIDKAGDHALRHTVDGSKPNSCGLYLDIDYVNDHLRQMFKDIKKTDMSPVHDMTWIFEELRAALRKKHRETFWVKALHNNNRQAEKFHYIEAEHTSNPYIDKMELLIETGLITMDYTFHLKPSGKVRDHGYLFKLKANSISALFPEPVRYDLTTGRSPI